MKLQRQCWNSWKIKVRIFFFFLLFLLLLFNNPNNIMISYISISRKYNFLVNFIWHGFFFYLFCVPLLTAAGIELLNRCHIIRILSWSIVNVIYFQKKKIRYYRKINIYKGSVNETFFLKYVTSKSYLIQNESFCFLSELTL